jgi:hypothetical protein
LLAVVLVALVGGNTSGLDDLAWSCPWRRSDNLTGQHRLIGEGARLVRLAQALPFMAE